MIGVSSGLESAQYTCVAVYTIVNTCPLSRYCEVICLHSAYCEDIFPPGHSFCFSQYQRLARPDILPLFTMAQPTWDAMLEIGTFGV